MSLNTSEISIVEWTDISKHNCGYCKSETGNISHGILAMSLTVEDYQNLIDRGWRRSGKFCYKPLMNETCCPQYTIKCDAKNFILSKSQKKVIKRFNKYLNDGIIPKYEANSDEESGTSSSSIIHKTSKSTVDTEINEKTEDKAGSSQDINFQQNDQSKQEKLEKKLQSGVGADPTKPPCKKAKLLRLEKKQKKNTELTKILENKEKINNNVQKTLEEFVNINENTKKKLKIKLIVTQGEEWENSKNLEFDLYKKYQMIVHNDPEEKINFKSFQRFLVISPLTITLEKMTPDHRTFKLSAKLYEKYQLIVHNDPIDDCNEEIFIYFLINTPLKYKNINGCDLKFGSYHQQYWLDDKLIAVGVIDILPKCVTSVYFFYDPDYRSLTLGTYGSLREIEFTRQLWNKYPTIQYYYLGFYIHSCQKMSYKGKLKPSYLLCPEAYKWVAFEKCLPKLSQSSYSKLFDNNDADAEDDNNVNDEDLKSLQIWLYTYRQHITLEYYKKIFKNENCDEFPLIGKLIGKDCIKTMVFIKN